MQRACPLCRPSRQGIHHRSGRYEAQPRLLPLRALWGWLLPRDEELGIEDGHLSPGVLRMGGIVGARVSFEEGHEPVQD